MECFRYALLCYPSAVLAPRRALMMHSHLLMETEGVPVSNCYSVDQHLMRLVQRKSMSGMSGGLLVCCVSFAYGGGSSTKMTGRRRQETTQGMYFYRCWPTVFPC
jgi:hypothetical protein